MFQSVFKQDWKKCTPVEYIFSKCVLSYFAHQWWDFFSLLSCPNGLWGHSASYTI